MNRLIAITLAACALASAPALARQSADPPADIAPTSVPSPADAALNELAPDDTALNEESLETGDAPTVEQAKRPTLPEMNRATREPARAQPGTRPDSVRRAPRAGLPASASRPQGSLARTQPNSASQSTRAVQARGVTARPVKVPAFKTRPVQTRGVRAQPITARGVQAHGVKVRGIQSRTVKAQGVKARPVTARGVTTQPVRARPVTVGR